MTPTPGQIPASPDVRDWPRLRFDEHGRAIPLTDAEQAADLEALAAALAAMDSIPDDPPGSDEEFWRAIDEGRPERPLFEEFYRP